MWGRDRCVYSQLPWGLDEDALEFDQIWSNQIYFRKPNRLYQVESDSWDNLWSEYRQAKLIFFTLEELCFGEKYWKLTTLPFVLENSYASVNWRWGLLSWKTTCFLNSLCIKTCLRSLALLGPSILNDDVTNCCIPVLYHARHLCATWCQNCKLYVILLPTFESADTVKFIFSGGTRESSVL